MVQKRGSGYTSPVATATGGGFTTACSLGTPTLLNGVITAISATLSASDAGQVSIKDLGGTGSGFVGSFTVASPGTSGQVTFLIESGGSGYSTNLELVYNYGVVAGATITVSNGVIGSVPVLSPGVGYTTTPTITITDGGPGTGVVAAPIMTGPMATDLVSYSAPAGWLTTAAGAVPASTNAAMFSFNGELEPNFAQVPRTMKLAMNIMAPFGYAQGRPFTQNWLHAAANWAARQHRSRRCRSCCRGRLTAPTDRVRSPSVPASRACTAIMATSAGTPRARSTNSRPAQPARRGRSRRCSRART